MEYFLVVILEYNISNIISSKSFLEEKKIYVTLSSKNLCKKMNQILDFLIEFKSFSKKNFSKKEESSIRFFSRIRS